VSVEREPREEDVRTVRDGLLAFNVERLGDPKDSPVAVFARDDDGSVVGGLIGEIRWGWLYVAKLWVHEAHRGRGLGKQLLETAEAHARDAGCIASRLDTFDFQARPFYEGLGYRLFGQLEGYPPGGRAFYLWKPLSPESTPRTV
jgi:GNAT superfamily N-acetyltransferase